MKRLKTELFTSAAADLERAEAYLQLFMQSPEDGGTIVDEVAAHLRESTGKRIRPVMVMLCGKCGAQYPQKRKKLAIAAALTEMIHCASLVHDDIVDDSPLRRGKPTVQNRFGKDVAVYAGDMMLAKMMYYTLEAGLYETGSVLAQAILKMCHGEMVQKDMKFSPGATEEQYWKAVEGKTAALFEAACCCGAMEGGCAGETVAHLRQFGRLFGLIFQLRDDLLDLTSGVLTEGKPVHQDFRNGILTLPSVYALNLTQTRSMMLEALRLLDSNQNEAVDMMEEALVKSGAVEYAYDCLEKLYNEAHEILQQLPICDTAEELLQLLNLLHMGK